MNPIMVFAAIAAAAAGLAAVSHRRTQARAAAAKPIGSGKMAIHTALANSALIVGVINHDKMAIHVKLPSYLSAVVLGGNPYGLESTVAMAQTALSWAKMGVPASRVYDPWQAQLLAILAARNLTEREKVRAIICSVILPLVANEARYSPVDTGDVYLLGAGYGDELAGWRIRIFRAWLDQAQAMGTELQQTQIAHLAIWLCMYFLGPETGAVRKGCALMAPGSAMPPLYAPIDSYRDADWQMRPDPDQQRRAILDIYIRVTGYMRERAESVRAHNACGDWDPSPCDTMAGWDQALAGFAVDEALLHHSPEATASATLKIVQLISRIELVTLAPERPIPSPSTDPFSVIMGIVGAVASVATMGAATGIIAPAIASTMQMATSAVKVGIGLAQSFTGGASAGKIFQAALNSSLGKSLTSEAALLLPPDVTAAAATIQQYSPRGF